MTQPTDPKPPATAADAAAGDQDALARVVPLPRGALARVMRERAPAAARLEALIAGEDTAEAVAALDPLELFELLADVGLEDATEVALLATPDQIQRFFDLDLWRREHLVPARFERWLALFLKLPDDRFARFFDEIDPEVVPLYLKSQIEVFPADEHGQPPEDAPEGLAASPGGAYFILYPDDATRAWLCRTLIERVYDAFGVMIGWRTLESVRWELQTEMEEAAFQFRRARLEEMGFPDREAALALHATSGLEPAALRERLWTIERGDGPVHALSARGLVARMPERMSGALMSARRADSLFARCLERVDEGRWAALQLQLIHLGNLVAALNHAEPGDLDAGARAFELALATVDVGLEFTVGDDPERGARLLDRAPLRQVYQVGYGLLRKLHEQALRLSADQRLTLTDRPASLLDDDDQALLEGLLRFYPRGGDGAPFRHHADVERAAQRLARVAFTALLFFDLLRFDRAELAEVAYRDDLNLAPPDVRFSSLLATLVLRHVATGAPGIQPLDPADLPVGAPALRDAFATWRARNQLAGALPDGMRALADRLLDSVEAGVVDELGALDAAPDPRFVTRVLVRRTPD